MNKSIKQTVVGSVSRGTRALGAKRTHTVVSKNAAAVNAARKGNTPTGLHSLLLLL
jgi:hypothetical protein